MRHDADPAQIQPVRVPTSLDCHVRVIPLVRVTCAGPMQEPKVMVIQIENATKQFSRELGGTGAVFGIGHLAEPPRIVEDGEQRDDFHVRTRLLGQTLTVFKDSRPMRNTVIAVERQSVVFERGVEDELEVHAAIVPLRRSEAFRRSQLNTLTNGDHAC